MYFNTDEAIKNHRKRARKRTFIIFTAVGLCLLAMFAAIAIPVYTRYNYLRYSDDINYLCSMGSMNPETKVFHDGDEGIVDWEILGRIDRMLTPYERRYKIFSPEPNGTAVKIVIPDYGEIKVFAPDPGEDEIYAIANVRGKTRTVFIKGYKIMERLLKLTFPETEGGGL